MSKASAGCVQSSGRGGDVSLGQKESQPQLIEQEVQMVQAKVGGKAPDFQAPAYLKGEFTQVKLSDYAGKWLMLCFYPGDFTFVWPTEISAVAGKYPEFQKLGVEVMAISVDSNAVHKMWDENELSKMVDGGIPFHLVSDGGGNLGKMYGIYDENAGVNIRGKFLIDPDGVVQAMEVLAPPVGRNVDETLRQIRAFQHVRQTGAKEVCPAGWEPGKLTLKPGPDLVGKVWKEWK